MDPLAGIDANLPGPEATDEKDVFDVTTLRYNLQHVDTIRSVMNIASGCAAGILGLTGWQGLGALQNALLDAALGCPLDVPWMRNTIVQ